MLKFCPKSPMLDFMVNRSYFFIFVTWYSWIIVWILVGIHENGDRKNWSADDRPPRRNPPRRRKGPSLGTRWFNFFFFCLPWIPPKFQFFLSPFSWIPPKIQTIIHEYQVTKIKKYERFTMKSNIGDFGQNFSTSILQYIKSEFKYNQEFSSICNSVSLTLC